MEREEGEKYRNLGVFKCNSGMMKREDKVDGNDPGEIVR